MPSLFDPGWAAYYRDVALAFALWTSLWVWLSLRRAIRFSLRSLVILIIGYVVMAALAINYIDFIIHYHERHP
jgi:hypothetical protein